MYSHVQANVQKRMHRLLLYSPLVMYHAPSSPAPLISDVEHP
jgi:hypothetical protein